MSERPLKLYILGLSPKLLLIKYYQQVTFKFLIMRKFYLLILVFLIYGNVQAQVEGTWTIAPEAQSLAVGPALGDFSWWSNSADDVNGRACLFDDKFIFNSDGTFENVQDGDTWLEAWQGTDPEACGAPVAPHDGSAAATWSYDAGTGELTITGTGAHLGLAKVINGGELAAPSDAPESITYPVVIEDDRMTIDINFGPGFWHFVLVKDGSTSGPTVFDDTKWVLSPEAQALAVGPALGDFTWWSNTADDVTTRACLFDDQFVFNADGTFQNIMDGDSWIEAWQGMDPEGCGAPVAPHDGSAAATWSYDEDAGELTLTGTGAHLGLAKVVNGAELTAPSEAPESITYPVTLSANSDTMTVDINFGPGFWHFVFVQAEDDPVAGDLSGTSWQIAPEAQSLAVGPAMGDFSWWATDENAATERACLYDDKFNFYTDGTFQNVQDGDTWLEAWQGMDPEGCGVPVAPHDGSALGTWSYDEAAGTITLTGTGSHLGLPKVVNGAELTAPSEAPESITYPVVFESADRMVIDINFGPGFWHFVLERTGSVTTDVVEITEEEFITFYPNPANDFVTVKSTTELDRLVVRDITGQVMMINNNPTTNEIINVSGFMSGLYIIEAHAGNKISIEKLSVN